MLSRYLFCATGCLGILLAASNSSAQPGFHQEFVCSSGSETRIVSIININSSDKQSPGACRVDYTKGGVTKTLWSSKTGHAYCVTRATQLVTKLTLDRYTCRRDTAEQPDHVEAPS